jgi:Protein of unknown function (DUF4054)
MTVTVGQIQAEFPEFAHTDPALIGYRIDDAMRLVDQAAFGARVDAAVKYLACHLVALMPHGEPARLVESQEGSGASTTYERQYLALRRTVFAPLVV